MLAPFTNELDKIAPSFKINGSQIRIIKTPADFYETLKVGILYALPLNFSLTMTGKDTEC